MIHVFLAVPIIWMLNLSMNKKDMKKNSTLAIIGVGNPLRKDDGIGILLLNKLKKEPDLIPDTVSLIDGGTGGLSLLYIFNKFDRVIILDAVDFDQDPAETKFFSLDDIKSLKKVSSVSTHNADLFQIIRFGQEMDECPDEIFIFGIQPADVCFGEGLTEELESNLDDIFAILKKRINPFLGPFQK